MLLRKVGKTLLGKATPFHLIVSCVIGAWMGFSLPFGDAPALWIVLVAAICLFPVNGLLLGLTGLLAYPVSLAVMPLSFHVGRFLLDGPPGPLFSALINAPFTALMGLEHYAQTGGLLVGALLGVAAGWGMSKLTRRIRRGFRELDSGNEKFHAWASKWWVGLLTWLLLGAKPKAATYEKLEKKRVGMPVRPAGAVVAVVLVAGFLWAGYQLSGPILSRTLKAGLERVNGATVDLLNAEIRLGEASVVIEGLAMADPKKLETDLLRGLKLEADIGVGDLLTKRFRVERLVISQASSGDGRETPGKLTGTEPVPEDVPGDEKTLDDYLKDAREWKERLAQARRWLDRLTGQADPDDALTDAEREEREEGLSKRLERWVRERGYMAVTAEHLIKGAPSFSIGELRIEGLKAMQVNGKPFDIVGENLSTHPHLLDAAPRLSIKARDGSIVFDLALAGASKKGGENKIELTYKGLDGDTIGNQLKVAGTKPLSGGTIDFATKGTWQRNGTVNLPFDVKLKGTTVMGQKIEMLELPLKMSGPLDDPRILFRDEDLKSALLKAGKGELAKRIGEQLPEGVKEKLGDAGNLLERLKKK